MDASFNRRNFLKIAGLASAAGTVGCSHEQAGTLVSLVVPGEQQISGVANWYATTCRECPAGCGMTVRTREGRAVKVEGNSEHPLSRGGLCVRGQASLQGLYNPDRFRGPLRRKPNGAVEQISWDDALKLLKEKLAPLASGAAVNRVAYVSGARGPAMDKLVREWLAAFGSTRGLVCEPFSHEPLREANRLLFGKPVVSAPLIATADYLISFGADYLESWLAPVAFTRDFASMRHSPETTSGMPAGEARRPGKIVHIEPRLSLTAANADEWHAVVAGTEIDLALAMAHTILANGLSKVRDAARLRGELEPHSAAAASSKTGIPAGTIEKLAGEFAAAKSSLAIGGGAAVSGQRATELQVAVQLLNFVAGRIGSSVRLDESFAVPHTAGAGEWKSLIEAAIAGQVDVLFVHGANLLHGLPQEMGLAEAVRKVPLVVSLSSYQDETSELAHLILPDHSPLEQWGDFRPLAGVHSLQQPAMKPLFDTRQSGDLLLSVVRQAGGKASAAFAQENFQGYLKEIWRAEYGRTVSGDFDHFWSESLRRGGHWPQAISGADSARGSVEESLSLAALPGLLPPAAVADAGTGAGEYHLHAYPSTRYYDGRGANRPWLHEIPDPITNITWDSWVEIHPETAKSLGVAEGDVMILQSAAGMLEAPAYLYEGIRKDTVAMPLGLGHTAFGRYAQDVGANPMRLLSAKADARTGALAYAGTTVKLSKAARRTPLARTDGSLTQHGRGISQIIPVSVLLGGTGAAAEPAEQGHEAGRHLASVHYPDNYPEHEHKDYRWGMAVNLSSCTGCSACVAACYAENNVPVVGKQQVAMGRSMAWLRIDRFIESVSETPDVRFAPVMCQQCDNAPCEPVCPVYATQHNSEGLNVQTYNRCVGTRYCANNCPYKVRSFNWFDPRFDEPLNLQLNPDVSIRSKGIMEKCTFCIQRIRGAKEVARDEGRKVQDGDIAPACAQSCPAQAIVFGNLLDPESAVSRLSANQHGYKILEELNTKPAVTYLPRVKHA